jgi:dTDP-4-dehydrorhamnose reductase
MLRSGTKPEIWGGLECTVNRVKNDFFDQLAYAGHYDRPGDIAAIAALGIQKIRYPLLWEKYQPEPGRPASWSRVENKLDELRGCGTGIIAGLVHHGSGPAHVNLLDESFAEGLAAYARSVAEKFPWIEYYTPVNEPLTTARFCGLYGLWYPHGQDDQSFYRILLNECRATVLAMQQIRQVNPGAKLVLTEDLGKVHSTPLLAYQADFENHRRWLSCDLMAGKVDSAHPLWPHLRAAGIRQQELDFFRQHACLPDILGFNHYLTSERYLDEQLDQYPAENHGGNGRHRYADVEAVRVGHLSPDGPYRLLKEAWARYGLPMAVTEVHLHCSREEQMRWLSAIWETACRLRAEGIDLRAVTAWALLGSFGWNRLLTQPGGDYEPGVFDISHKQIRPTALTGMIRAYSCGEAFEHPVLSSPGWWQRPCRVIYGRECIELPDLPATPARPMLITGKTGTLGQAFARICGQRGISCRLLSREEMDISRPESIERVIRDSRPWAIVNAAGFVRVDAAEGQAEACFAANTEGPANLARLCARFGIQLVTYSSDLVFDGLKTRPYTEQDVRHPLSVYGQSKSMAEEQVLHYHPEALIIRSSAFFGPWDTHNFLHGVLDSLRKGRHFEAISDVTVSPTYLPDLVQASLDLLLDQATGIWHLCNNGQISWAALACTVAERSRLNTALIKSRPLSAFAYPARRPAYSVLGSRKGLLLPGLDQAIDRYLAAVNG